MAPSSHAKRWITVAFVVPVLIVFFLYAPPAAVTVLASIVMALGLWEYYNQFCGVKQALNLGYLLAVATGSLIMAGACRGSFDLMVLAYWMAFMAYAGRALFRYNQGQDGFELLAKEALSILYVPTLLAAMILIRTGNNGVAWLFLVLFLAFISDTGAFYGGKFFGKHKLIPNVSPGKTVEGSIGSIVADLVVVSVFKLIVPAMGNLSWSFMICLAVFAAVATQMGDLFESMLKRSFGVKDSGIFFPGHGGMLDRIDGALFTAPVVYCFQLLANS